MDRPRAHHNGKSDFNQARGSGLYPDLFCKGSGPFASVRAALQIAGRASPIIESASRASVHGAAESDVAEGWLRVALVITAAVVAAEFVAGSMARSLSLI